MKVHNVKKNVFIIAVVCFVGLGIFLYLNRSKFWDKGVQGADESVSESTYNSQYMDGISEELANTRVKNRRELLINFCKVVLGKGQYIDTSAGYEYNPAKSTFMYAVCMPFESDVGATFDSSLEEILKSKGAIEKNVKPLMQGSCDAYDKDKDMNGCYFSDFLNKIFSKIMNDYSNIKLANVYGLSDNNIDESITKFSKQNFGEDVCGGQKNYISQEDSDSEDVAYCSHPKTYKMMSDSLKSLKTLLENSTYIDADKAIDQKCDDGGGDFIKCAFDAENKSIASKEFKNLVMNDLMYYNMLLGYYGFLIQADSSLMPITPSNFVGSELEKNYIEVQVVDKEIFLAQKSVANMIRLLVGIKNNYPMHVGLMAYYEDTMNFRNELEKVLTPITGIIRKAINYEDLRK